MGTWGPGNFDDDTARDYLGDVIGRFEAIIDRILAGDIPDEAMGLDNLLDAGEHCLLPTVEIMIAIYDTLGSDYFPSPEKVARWSKEYSSKVEPLMRAIDPIAFENWYIPKRRPVVADTFERLLQLSNKHHEGEHPEFPI